MFQRSSHMPTTTKAEAMTVPVTGLALSHLLTPSKNPNMLKMSKIHKTVERTPLFETAATAGALILFGRNNAIANTATATIEPIA